MILKSTKSDSICCRQICLSEHHYSAPDITFFLLTFLRVFASFLYTYILFSHSSICLLDARVSLSRSLRIGKNGGEVLCVDLENKNEFLHVYLELFFW